MNDDVLSISALPADPVEEGSIYELIRNDIISGQLRANERLKVVDLAKRYGTSTNPIREALQQLQGEGLVVIAPNKGATVRTIDEHLIREIYEVNAVLDGFFAAPRHHDLVGDLVALQGPERERLVVRVVLHQEDGLRGHMYESTPKKYPWK